MAGAAPAAAAARRSKRQGAAGASTFGPELVALRVGMEMNEGLCYKLRVMGAPIGGGSNAFCGSQAVAGSSPLPEPQLKEKQLSTCYHYVRECCAKLAAQIAFEPTHSNFADICTKVLGWQKRRGLCQGGLLR